MFCGRCQPPAWLQKSFFGRNRLFTRGLSRVVLRIERSGIEVLLDVRTALKARGFQEKFLDVRIQKAASRSIHGAENFWMYVLNGEARSVPGCTNTCIGKLGARPFLGATGRMREDKMRVQYTTTFFEQRGVGASQDASKAGEYS